MVLHLGPASFLNCDSIIVPDEDPADLCFGEELYDLSHIFVFLVSVGVLEVRRSGKLLLAWHAKRFPLSPGSRVHCLSGFRSLGTNQTLFQPV